MNGNVVFAAAMDVEEIAEIALRHRRAFDMPAGKAAPPRAVPFHLTLFAGTRKFPQRKVGGPALLRDVDALSGFESLDVEPREMTVIGLLAGVEIDAVGCAIREPFFLDVGDERDLIGDMVRCAAKNRRRLDVEELQIGEKRIRVHPCDFPRRFAGSARALLHLVFARVGVGGQMADVGDVHHVLHAIAIPFQRAAQRVLE